jgi:hypothetical protein
MFPHNRCRHNTGYADIHQYLRCLLTWVILQRRSAVAEDYRSGVIEIPEGQGSQGAAVDRVIDRQMPRFSIDDLIGIGPVTLTRSVPDNTQFTGANEFETFGAGETELYRGGFGCALNHQIA